MNKIRGVATVEFAIVGGVLLMVIFGCLEFGRATYTLAVLNEGTQRAARLAAVCPIQDPVIAPAVAFGQIAGFNNTITCSSGGNVNLQYLDITGTPLACVPASTSLVYYVRVGVTGYNIPLFIPGLNLTIASPPYTVTLPAESLGVTISGTNVVSTPC